MASKFITVSVEIMHDENLNQSQKFIMAEIEQLSSLEHGCIASNQHFAELIGISKSTVSRAINNLVDMGYVVVEIEPGSRNHVRLLTLRNMPTPPTQNAQTPYAKCLETKGNKQTNIQTNIQDYVDLWNQLAVSCTLSPVRTISKIRKQKLIKRIKEDDNFNNNFHDMITAIEESDFLKGHNDNGWKVSFDWVIHNDVNYLKVLEGNYKNFDKPKQKSVSKSSNNAKDQVAAFFLKKNQGEFIDAEIN